MSDDTTPQCLLFPDIFPKPVVAQFDQRQGSSDGGALLLKAADRRLGLTEALAESLVDQRQVGKIDHALEELLRQRIFGIACGYADANDAARLAEDPVHKMLVGRDPIEGDDLASQPTLSRFENAVDRKQLYRLGEALAECVIERHRRRLHGRAWLITIDLDPTDDPTHGAQQPTFFNRHHDTWCYLSHVDHDRAVRVLKFADSAGILELRNGLLPFFPIGGQGSRRIDATGRLALYQLRGNHQLFGSRVGMINPV